MSSEFPSSIVSTEPFTFCGRGEVWSYTIVERDNAPERFVDYTPYVIALIKLEEGPFRVAQLTDPDFKWETIIIDGKERQVLKFNFDNVEIGMPVEMVTRVLFVEGDPDSGLFIYGYKFRPLLERSIGTGREAPPLGNNSGGTWPEVG